MIDNQIVEQEINDWKSKILKMYNVLVSDLLELAFFKIYVKFEFFLVETFEKYVLGTQSKTGFIPQRKLNFSSDSQLRDMLQGNNPKNYLELTADRIEKLSKHIFEDTENPFFDTFNDSFFSAKYKEMTTIRNLIAHESKESKKQYQKKVLKSYNITSFLDLKSFFQRQYQFGNQQKMIFDGYIDLLDAHAKRIAEFNP